MPFTSPSFNSTFLFFSCFVFFLLRVRSPSVKLEYFNNRCHENVPSSTFSSFKKLRILSQPRFIVFHEEESGIENIQRDISVPSHLFSIPFRARCVLLSFERKRKNFISSNKGKRKRGDPRIGKEIDSNQRSGSGLLCCAWEVR